MADSLKKNRKKLESKIYFRTFDERGTTITSFNLFGMVAMPLLCRGVWFLQNIIAKEKMNCALHFFVEKFGEIFEKCFDHVPNSYGLIKVERHSF